MPIPNTGGKKKHDKMYANLKQQISDDRIDLLHRYFEAASNFYQIIPLKRLLRIINSQNSEQYTEDDFLAYVEIARHEQNFYEICGLEELFDSEPESAPINRLLVHESLLECEDYVEMYSKKQGRAYYVPEKDELLAYEDDFYLENTPQTKAMCEFCKQVSQKSDDEAIEDFLGEILFTVKSENSSPFEALEFINQRAVRLDVNEKNLTEFIRLYCELHNNTRNPYLNGFTPSEWFQKTGSRLDSYYLAPEDY